MQTEVEAFLKRVLAYPEDDAPRLIFADWLEDQATSHLIRSRIASSQAMEWSPERGRFIRIQIALARLREEATREVELSGLSKRDSAFNDLVKEEQSLEKKYEAEWIAPFQGLGPPTGLEFHRGFVEKLNIDAKDLVRHEHALFAASPLRHICLMNVGDCLPGVFRCSCLNRLAALTINHSRIGIPLARAVAQAENLAGIRKLHLTVNNFDDEAIQHLVASPILANLEELDLSENEKMGETSARALASTPHLGALRTLDLGNNRLGPVGAEAVVGSERLTNLQKLVLANNGIGIARLQTLSWNNGFFRVPILDLSKNYLVAAGLQVVLNRNPGPTEPGSNRLRDLNLSGNPIGDDGTRVLAACRYLEHLRILRLAGCGIGDEGVRVLASSPFLNNVVVLDLSSNPIGDTGCKYLLDRSHLRNLKLPITPVGPSQRMREVLDERFPARMSQM
jgi:uncharacterized protein (TIGR02996 family)